MKKQVIAIVGPTAVGKTKLSIEMAKRFDGEIISGDSMQVYRGMDIGTAKVTEEGREGIPHYMLDIKQPSESFSAGEFKEMVQQHISDIHGRGKVPIIVGGSGLYIQSLLYDYRFPEVKRDEAKTKELELFLKENGNDALYERLREIDSVQAEKIHPNNYRRVIRAIEVYETTGVTMTEHQAMQSLESPYDPILIGLEMERALLYERINQRVDEMMENGLLEEVRKLYEEGLADSQVMKAIGYKEFLPYLQGETSLESCVATLKQNSRRYAKRQYTWFKNKMDVTWYEVTPESIDSIFEIIFTDLAGILTSASN